MNIINKMSRICFQYEKTIKKDVYNFTINLSHKSTLFTYPALQSAMQCSSAILTLFFKMPDILNQFFYQ
jgi:hypothetical protein